VELKTDPGPAGLESMLAEIAKLKRLRAIGLPSDQFADVAPKARQGYRQRVQVEEPYELRRHPEPVRSTLLAAWAALRSGELTDNLVDTLVQAIERIDTTAQHRVEQELLADFRRVTGKTGLLFRVAEASVERPDGIVREVVFPAVGGERVLRDLVSEYKATGPGYRRKFHQATSLVLPAPGGEATTTAGSPDQAAKSAAASVGSVWCGAAGFGANGGDAGLAEETSVCGSVRTGSLKSRCRPRPADSKRITRQPRRPRRAARRVFAG
jgi:hypothetical protein